MMKPLNAVQLLVKAIIDKAEHYKWSYQGLGMFRLYLSKEVRLHVWLPDTAVANVSTLHTHPWSFRSVVVFGRLVDILYEEEKDSGVPYRKQMLHCGEGGGLVGSSEPVNLIARHPWVDEEGQVYEEGQDYVRYWRQIHESKPEPGTVTLVTRRFEPDTEHAHVYWPEGTEWVSAEPRAATNDEVRIMSETVRQKHWPATT